MIQVKQTTPFGIKVSPFQYKEIDTAGRTVKMVVNTLNYYDHDYDVLVKGCANRSMSHRGAKSEAPDKIVHLLHHDMHRPVGKSLSESEETIDGKLALVCSSFLPETIDGDDTLTKYEVGIYNQHSIGFQYKDIEYIEKETAAWDKFLKLMINPEDAEEIGYGWLIKEIKWWEYSTVTFGANKLTPYLGTKSENKIDIADALSKKIAILATKAMRREIKNEEAFKFELSQLQQMVFELSEAGSLKQVHPKGTDDESQVEEPVKLSLNGFSKNLTIKIN